MWTLTRVRVEAGTVGHRERVAYRSEHAARRAEGLSAQAWRWLRSGGTVQAGADAYLMLSLPELSPLPGALTR